MRKGIILAGGPLYGVLDKRSLWQATQITPVHWRKQLRQMVKELSG